jgi:hypothetical protein
MVVEEDRAGATVMCPNCRRSLKVPSGKDRGVHIASAPSSVRTSRLCQRCGKEVPVDSQMCPHCKAILLDAQGAAPAAPKAAVRAAAGRVSAAAAAMAGQGVIYGGARGSWFSRLTPGGKAGVIGGFVGFVGVLAIVVFIVHSSWASSQLAEARLQARTVMEKGRKLENIAEYQDAYELSSSACTMDSYLRESGDPKDAQAADAVQARFLALQYLAKEPKIRGALFWRPNNQDEYNEAKAELQKTYQPYKEWVLAVADAGLAAVQLARSSPGNQAGYDQKVGQTMDTFVKFVSQTTEYQRAQRTFKQLIEGVKQLGAANRSWAKPGERDNSIKMAEAYLSAAKECATLGQDDLVAR